MPVYGRKLVQLQLRLNEMASQLADMAAFCGEEGSPRTCALLEEASTRVDAASRVVLRELEAADRAASFTEMLPEHYRQLPDRERLAIADQLAAQLQAPLNGRNPAG